MSVRNMRIVFVVVIILFSLFALKDIFFSGGHEKIKWIRIGLDAFVIVGNCIAFKLAGKNKPPN